ncbi:aldo/keto reductase [Actinomadura rayongensis]|uniref:Aldo/keto reductase n=1 Tax=Actinomadura rayongensis TaxID=1429076 RepID=A0A6I4W8C8_9ACTN|nr:aldo/keto reductase [Actinomadura rayongensis]MXQ65020.1 aldo/keto reductase [Actinomadura rayongensis]
MSTIPETRYLRGLGRPVSSLGAGCWTIGGAATNRGVPIGWDGVDSARAFDGLLRAHELGVTLYDTADVYGLGHSERLLGRLLAHVPRHEVTVSSKVGYFASAAHPYAAEQMRRQLERTLRHLGIDYLDLYFFHSTDFGEGDQYLARAVKQMRAFVEHGLVRAIGMRAPHTFALEWATGPSHDHRCHEAARFLHLYQKIRPDVLTVRYNLLSPLYAPGETDVFDLAKAQGVAVIIKQALGQGILLGTHHPDHPRTFGRGDHRRQDPTFTPEALREVHRGLSPVRERYGATVPDMARLALRYALARDPTVPVLVGFRDAEQINTTITSLGEPLADDEITWLRRSLAPLRDAFAARTAKHHVR